MPPGWDCVSAGLWLGANSRVMGCGCDQTPLPGPRHPSPLASCHSCSLEAARSRAQIQGSLFRAPALPGTATKCPAGAGASQHKENVNLPPTSGASRSPPWDSRRAMAAFPASLPAADGPNTSTITQLCAHCLNLPLLPPPPAPSPRLPLLRPPWSPASQWRQAQRSPGLCEGHRHLLLKQLQLRFVPQ